MKRQWWVVTCWLSGACAAQAPTAAESPNVSAMILAENQTASLLQHLEKTLEISHSDIDCDSICHIYGEICSLSLQICRISGENSSWADAQQRCSLATQRCESARKVASSRCNCQ